MSDDLISRHRIDALVDAVLAISMTLLVLELRLPEEIGGDVFGALRELTPKLISWVVSFLILAVCWRGYTRQFASVARLDTPLFWVITVWLLATSLVPFSSSLIGEHNELAQSHIVYAANVFLIEALVIARNMRLVRHAELMEEGRPARTSAGWTHSIIIAAAALASIGLATAVPAYASIAYLLILPASMVARRAGFGD